MGGERRECDFDAEARRRGDKRGEAAKSREDERGDSGGWWPSVRSGRGAWWRQCGGCGSNGRYEAGEFPGRVQCHGRTLVEWDGKRESVILTRRRGDKRGEAAKSREDERGDSGGWWPTVRSGRAFRRATSGEAAGKSCQGKPSSDTLIVP